MKVAKLTQIRPTLFKNGILGNFWSNWFKHPHLDLVFELLNDWMYVRHKVSQVNHATFFNKIYKHFIHNTNTSLTTFGVLMR